MLKSYAGAALTAHLTSPIASNDLTLACDALTGWPSGSGGPFSAIIDKGKTGLEEKVLCTSQAGGTIVVAIRGYDGTTACAHDSGAEVQHVGTSIDLAEANTHVNSTTGVHGLNAGDAVVGRSTPATLMNKVIDGATNDITNLPTSAVPSFIAAVDALGAEIDVLSGQFAALAVLPAGAILPYGGSTAPTGYLLCDGSQVSRTTYATLFGVIGTTYGAGNGSTTFTLPDLRGRFPLGTDGTHARGTMGGSATTTLVEANLASHSHALSTGSVVLSGLSTASTPDHTHTFTAVLSVPERGVYTAGGGTYALYNPGGTGGGIAGSNGTTTAGGNHTHTVTGSGSLSGSSSTTGSGTPATTISPYQAVQFVIKT